MIVNAQARKPLPVYSDGQQIRDWLYVKNHCSAIRLVLEAGKVGEVYNVGGWNENKSRHRADRLHTARRTQAAHRWQTLQGTNYLRDESPRPRLALRH